MIKSLISFGIFSVLFLGIFLFYAPLKNSPVFAQVFCSQNSDCAWDHWCDVFLCFQQSCNPAGPPTPLTCIGHSECFVGSVLSNHVCVAGNCFCAIGYCGTQCCSNSDCPSGYACDSQGYYCYKNCNQAPNSFCKPFRGGCPNNYYQNLNYSCDSSVDDICCTFKPTCNTGLSCSGWSACGGYPQNSCYGGNGSQSRTCQYTTYNNGGTSCTRPAPFTQTQGCTVNDCYANYTCTGGNCTTNIFVHVYTDYNHDGVKNGADTGRPGVRISNGGSNPTTDANGNVTFGGLTTGTYTIRETVPANFQAVNAASQNVTLTNNAGNQTVTFFLTPLYSISGRVFLDKNKNQKFDGADTGYGGGTINISGGPTPVGNITVAADGTWATAISLESGTYTVSYTTPLPGGYTFTTPSSYTVTVGDPAGAPACNKGGSLDGVCGGTNNGSISNLNIGLSNENAWNQTVCFDMRNDSGTYTDLIPAAPNCGGVSGAYNSITNGSCSTGAGIIFTCNASPNFGLGSANANNWQAGGVAANQQECFVGAGLNVIRTSYDYLLTTARESNITPIDMATVCGGGGLANCTLPATIAKGIYKAEGDVHLNAFTFPVDPTTPQGFIFLIHGNLYLMGNIIIPAGSVAAFSSSGNIFVDPSVGNVITNPSDPAVNNANIEGLYSADGNFIVQSYISGTNYCNLDGTPLDKKLNIVGSVISNAAQGGGSFQNNRDLCIYDTSCSAVTVGDGEIGSGGGGGGGSGNNNGLALSYLLTLMADGKFLNHKIYNWQEVRP